ncbi:hypothetical protein C8Q73DRAFT_722171 [Cubamyces lactineus]|nr:hypothetical protein C8Q73DRAFT_722171 [Cubamyces lactineus]
MAGVIASSPSPSMSSNEQPRTPSPVPRQEADVNADGASEAAQSSDIEAVADEETAVDPSFFDNHLNPCPESLLAKIQKRKDVKDALQRIKLVVSRDSEQKLYEPAATLLTIISKAILAQLKKAQKVDPDQRQIVFYDHHRHPLTHFPIPGRPEDYPDIVGVFEEPYGYEQRDDDGTYRNIPYHRVETVLEAKAIYGKDGKAQATRYAYKIQQARPDRPGMYVLSAKPGYFQVIFSCPVGPVASEHVPWTNLAALSAYVYSLYDSPDGHILYDRTVSWVEKPDQRFGRPSWTVRTGGKVYESADACFVGNAWARRTTILRVEQRYHRNPTTIIKEAYIDCDRRFNEADLLQQIHKDGYFPGVVYLLSSEEVKTGGQDIVFKNDSITRKKVRIVLADVGFDLYHAKSVNDLLMTIYDALEVHRTIASKRRVLHRDMSIFNIMMYPILGNRPDPRYAQDCPPLIDEVLDGKARAPEHRRARCEIIDLDNGADLTAEESDTENRAELRCRTGTPAYIARAVCCGAVYCDPSTTSWTEQMPLLDEKAKELYIKVYGEERYNKYNDSCSVPKTYHGGIPPEDNSLYVLEQKAENMAFYHRLEYDAESIFWTMYSALLRVTPVDFKETPKDITASTLSDIWRVLQNHVIPETPSPIDSRTTLLFGHRILPNAFPPVMRPVAHLLLRIIRHVLPSYPLMDKLPPYDDHLHEAMERLILQYLVDNRDTPIILKPHTLRALKFPDIHAANRGVHGGSLEAFESRHSVVEGRGSSRGEKRPLEAVDGPAERTSTKLRQSDRLRQKKKQ